MQNYYLIGSPISHSLSPTMHNTAFQALGIDAHYGLLEADLAGLPDAVNRLKRENAAGWNVTMPDKQAMCDLCDELSPSASISRSVNTVRNVDGKLYGYTTDGAGFLRAAKECGFRTSSADITLLGTGGAAVSILIACALNGAEKIHIFYNKASSADRMRPVIDRLTDHMKDSEVPEITLEPLGDTQTMTGRIQTTDLLVNATNVGMAGCETHDLSPLSDPACLTAGTDVFDAIYNPRETVLMRQARKAGLRASNGIPMLLYQGAESFRIWTGQDMPVETIRRTIFGE